MCLQSALLKFVYILFIFDFRLLVRGDSLHFVANDHRSVDGDVDWPFVVAGWKDDTDDLIFYVCFYFLFKKCENL